MTDLSTAAGQREHYAAVRARLTNPVKRIAAPQEQAVIHSYAPVSLIGAPDHLRIVILVGRRYGVSVAAIMGEGQAREVAYARHLAIALVFTHCQPMAVTKCAEMFGVTQSTVRYAVSKFSNPEDRILEAITPPAYRWKQIKAEVAKKHSVTLKEMDGPFRNRHIVRARQEACYRMKTETTMSYPEIGRRMGGIDHTTVIHGYRKHAARLIEEMRAVSVAGSSDTFSQLGVAAANVLAGIEVTE